MERSEVREGPIAIAVDKTSCHALKWAIEHYIPRGGTIKLVHVIQRSTITMNANGPSNKDELSERQHNDTKNPLLPLRCFCTRKNIQSEIVLLEDQDVAKALIEYISQNCISTLVIGASLKKSITRLFKGDDISSDVMRWAPNFCTILLTSKGKLLNVRSATRPFPQALPFPSSGTTPFSPLVDEAPFEMSLTREDDGFLEEFSSLDMNNTNGSVLSFYEKLGTPYMLEDPRFSVMNDEEEKSKFSIYLDSHSNEKICTLASSLDDADIEKRRLKKELKETMKMYHAACKEALMAKERAIELEIWKKKAGERLQMAEEAAKMAIMEMEKLRRR